MTDSKKNFNTFHMSVQFFSVLCFGAWGFSFAFFQSELFMEAIVIFLIGRKMFQKKSNLEV